MINFSIQNFIPFLVPPLFPLGLRSIKKEGIETKQVPVKASQVQNPLQVPHFLFVEKGFNLLGFC